MATREQAPEQAGCCRQQADQQKIEALQAELLRCRQERPAATCMRTR